MSVFRFKRFSVVNERSSMKVNTDGVLLGAAVTLCPEGSAILDIGTGTGTIALMLAQRLEGNCAIDAIDIDGPSAEEAGMNFASSPWASSLSARCIPLQDYEPDRRIDLIVSNPPYFDDSLVNQDSRRACARHSASLSYKDIIIFSESALSKTGRLALVMPSDCEKSLVRFAGSYGLHPERMVRIRTVACKPVSRIIAEFLPFRPDNRRCEEIVLMEEGHYTPQYSALVKEFYMSV